jgi:toxin-antitoxin system PIN domain toxin
MSLWLLDVNVLVARFWERHVFHEKVRNWLNEHESEGWATCAITQLGLVRTLSNPAFDEHAPRPIEAMHWLARTLRENTDHQFWPASPPVSDVCGESANQLHGFKQFTDAYLLGLAIQRKGRFVTLDRRILSLTPEKSEARKSLFILD